MSIAVEERPVPAVAIPARSPRAPLAARGRALWPWLRLALVAALAFAAEMVYVGFWPISYLLTQAPEYTYQYLLRHPLAWERLQPLLARLEWVWPGASRSLDVLVNGLMALFLASFLLYLGAYALARAGLPKAWGFGVVLGCAVAFHATLFLMPGLFTTDLFSYVIYGEIAAVYQQNPWTQMPANYPDNPIVGWIHPVWHRAPSIYGPAWIDLALPLASLMAESSEVDKVLAYKLLVNAAHFGSIVVLAVVVRRLRPDDITPSVLLYAWNPLIVFEFGGNGHNDAVMILGMLLGLLLFASRQREIGLVALTTSFLVKMSSVLLVPFYAIAWAREQRTVARSLGVLVACGSIVGIIVVGFYAPWWVGLETIGPILNWTAGPMFNNYVPDILAGHLATQYVLDPAAPDPAAALERARWWVKAVTRALFAAYCVWELFQARGVDGLAASGARVMAGFLLVVNTWVLPWYFTWPLILAVVAGWRFLSTRVLLGFSIAAPTVMYYHHFWHPYMADSTYALYLAPLLVAPLSLAATTVARRLPRETTAAAGLQRGEMR